MGGDSVAHILKGGNVVSKDIKTRINKRVSNLREKDKFPTLGIIRLGENSGDISYEKKVLLGTVKN